MLCTASQRATIYARFKLLVPACREKLRQASRTAVQDRRAAEDAEEDRVEEEMLAKLASEQEAVRKAEADRLKVRVPKRPWPL